LGEQGTQGRVVGISAHRLHDLIVHLLLERFPLKVRWQYDVAEDIFRERLVGGPVAVALCSS
jgi:hypothetical protein